MLRVTEEGDGPENPTPSGVTGVPQVSLTDVIDGPRFRAIHEYESHYRLTQDDDKRIDWYGRDIGTGVKMPGFIPMSKRKPSSMAPLAKVIVGRLTAMTLGADVDPIIQVRGDINAEDFARQCAEISQLWVRAIEARDLGGACGCVALSYGFVDGLPRVEVHNPKHCRVLRWKDRADLVVGAFLKTYDFVEEELNEKGDLEERRYFYARFIDDRRDLVWNRVPEDIAKEPNWFELIPPDVEVAVIGGECPVVWIQNRAQTATVDPPKAPYDGPSDYEGLCLDLAEAHRLKSAANKGTLVNSDPTLVVKAEKKGNSVIGKGSDAAIFAPRGAEYLTLPGDAMEAAETRIRGSRQDILDACGVVVPTPDALAGAARSAAALRILYAPMTAVCSMLRASYGRGLEQVLAGFLRIARALGSDELAIPGRVEREPGEVDEETGEETEPTQIEIEPNPGESEDVRIQWPPFFSPTWTDKKLAVETVKAASGGKSVLSQRSAVQAVGNLFGVEDPEEELEAIEGDTDRGLEREIQALAAARGPSGALEDEEGDEDDEEEGDGARPDGGPGTSEPEANG